MVTVDDKEQFCARTLAPMFVIWPCIVTLGPHSAFVLCHVLFFDLGLRSGLNVCDRLWPAYLWRLVCSP